MGFQDEEILKKKKELEQQKKLRESQDRLEKKRKNPYTMKLCTLSEKKYIFSAERFQI